MYSGGKKLILIVSLLFISALSFVHTSLYAQTDEDSDMIYIIDDFSGGRNSHASPYKIPKEECITAQNIRFNDEYGAFAKRRPTRSYGTADASNKITGIHRYYKSDDTQKLIVSAGTNVKVGDDDTGTFQTIKSSVTDGQKCQFVTYKDIVIGCNGTENTWKYDGETDVTANTDGHRTASCLCADLGAPFAELNTGANLDASSWYQYKVIFYDDTNYYYSNARSNPIQTGAAVKDIKLTDIPIGAVGTTKRDIYRTEGQADQATVEAQKTFKLVASLHDNTTREYEDAIADASLGTSWSTSGHNNVTPLTGSYCLIHDERLFIAGNTEEKSEIYWSDQFNPDYFLATDFEKIRPDDGDEITFIQTLLGILTIGKTNSIQKFYTDGSTTSSWRLSDAFTNIGCPAPYSVATTPIGIIYLGRHGLYVFNGLRAKLISDAVTYDINDIKQANIEDVFGVYWNNQYLMAYTSDASGASTNDKVLIYDIIRDSYCIDTRNVSAMATLESGSDFGSLYYGDSTEGVITKDGTEETYVFCRYKSDLDDGTIDDMRTFDTEEDPSMKLAWDLTLGADWTIAENLTIGDMTASGNTMYLIQRRDRDGTWLSPVYEINASTLNKLYWNEDLGSMGDVEAKLRLASTAAGITSASWSSMFTTPSGADISGVTADDYLQIQFNLSTSNILYTPELESRGNFVWKLSYSKEGTDAETAIPSVWESGWLEFKKGYRSLIKRIRVFYEDENTGNIYLEYKSLDDTVDETITINLSQDPPFTDSDGGVYAGVGGEKTYSYYPNTDTIGQMWKIKVYDNSINYYKIKRIEILYALERFPDV